MLICVYIRTYVYTYILTYVYIYMCSGKIAKNVIKIFFAGVVIFDTLQENRPIGLPFPNVYPGNGKKIWARTQRVCTNY